MRIRYLPSILAFTAFVSLAYILFTSAFRPYETSRGLQTTEYRPPPVVSLTTPTPSRIPSPVSPMQLDRRDEAPQTSDQNKATNTPELDNQIAASQEDVIIGGQFSGFAITRDPYDNSRSELKWRDGLDTFYVELNITSNECYGTVGVVRDSGEVYLDNKGRDIPKNYVKSASAVGFNYPSCVMDPTNPEQVKAFAERHLSNLR